MRTRFVLCCLIAAGCGPSTGATPGDLGTAPADLSAPPDAPLPDDGSGACGANVQPASGLVVTTNGPVQGVAAGATWKYLGIPFAQPPVGALRFAPPAAPTCDTNIRVADHFASRCPQLDDNNAYIGDEDCLYLNVWTPQAAAPSGGRPVLFFIHGGGHVQGSASAQGAGGAYLYDGQSLAESQGAVVVTINYRLGALGYLAHPALVETNVGYEGNYGTLDQIAALRWARDNIAKFGGDPSHLMIFGESAGAVSVCTLVATPLAHGLFSSALMESGACVAQAKAKAETLGGKVVQAAKCDTAADIPACLRALTAEALVTAYPVKPDVAGIGGDQYGAVIDNAVLSNSPLAIVKSGAHNHVPLVVGVNSDETSRTSPVITSDQQYQSIVLALAGGNQTLANAILAQYPSANYATPRAAYVALSTDAKFICTARQAARAALAGQTEPVFRYLFSQPLENSPQLKPFGAWHGIELPFVFGVLHVAGYSPSDGEIALSASIQSYWAHFASTGDPNSMSATAWPPYDSRDPYLELRAFNIIADVGLHTLHCDFWDSFK